MSEQNNQNTQESQTPHKRRVRYKGKYPKKFEEKYKELQPEKYKDTCNPEGKYSCRNAHFHHGK